MQVSIRELKANPSYAIALMQRGEVVQITSHRKVVAELIAPRASVPARPAMTDEEAMQRLVDSGAVAQMATKRLKLPLPVIFAPTEDGQSMSDLVLDMRGQR